MLSSNSTLTPKSLSTPDTMSESHKDLVRTRVWTTLRTLAVPDSRFHHDYTSFIPDFIGSSLATAHLTSLPIYRSSPILFIAPDNCLQELRHQALKDGKTVLVTSYGIRRGFFLLNPAAIPEARWEIASLLDGMERVGRHLSLTEIKTRFGEQKIRLMITGAGAINHQGMRFGKGRGYFDLEFAMLADIGVVGVETKTVALVHECQVLDEELRGEEWDVGCDFVVTDQRVLEVKGAVKPGYGVLWGSLGEGMEEGIEPLRELWGLLREGDGDDEV